MNPPKEHPHEEQFPERPFECAECRKPITVLYTEIVGSKRIKTCMCKECPELMKKLSGTKIGEHGEGQAEKGTGLVCGSCGTTLSSVRISLELGCRECYEVFGDVILGELVKEKRVHVKSASIHRKKSVHIGRQPGKTQELKPSLKLLALNEALKETLEHEDYEQAAWLRDQIKEITEENKKST